MTENVCKSTTGQVEHRENPAFGASRELNLEETMRLRGAVIIQRYCPVMLRRSDQPLQEVLRSAYCYQRISDRLLNPVFHLFQPRRESLMTQTRKRRNLKGSQLRLSALTPCEAHIRACTRTVSVFAQVEVKPSPSLQGATVNTHTHIYTY